MPYRPWCKIRLRAKARGTYHKQQYDRQPLLQDRQGHYAGYTGIVVHVRYYRDSQLMCRATEGHR